MRWCLLTPALVFCLAAPAARAQFSTNVAADRVLGQDDFVTATVVGVTRSSMEEPSGVAVDPVSGKVFVSISGQNRILRYASGAALANGADAEAVIGQPDDTSSASGTAVDTLDQPYGIDVDASGQLWVADYGNNRVLMYEDAANLPEFSATASLVLGQPDFDTASAATSRTKMNGPTGVHVDDEDNLWVADFGNHRVLKFKKTAFLPDGANASNVLGQPDFDTAVAGTDEVTMNGPVAVLVDAEARLWVAEQTNHRVLRFELAAMLPNGSPADGVLGQPDFDTADPGTGPAGLGQPNAFAIDPAGTLYILDYENSRVVYHRRAADKADGAAADGVICQPDLTTATGDTTARKLDGPYGGLDFDAAGNLWVSDFGNNRALRFPTDRIAATLRITGRVPRATYGKKLALRGTASDPGGIAAVRYRVGGRGAYRNAAGTTAWRCSARLKRGKNKIDVIAVDTAGNITPPKVVRVRQVARGKGGGDSGLPPFLIIRS